MSDALTWRRLSTGYLHIRGVGPCNWAQVPCDRDGRPEAGAGRDEHVFPEAGDEFRAGLSRLIVRLRRG